MTQIRTSTRERPTCLREDNPDKIRTFIVEQPQAASDLYSLLQLEVADIGPEPDCSWPATQRHTAVWVRNIDERLWILLVRPNDNSPGSEAIRIVWIDYHDTYRPPLDIKRAQEEVEVSMKADSKIDPTFDKVYQYS